MHILSRAEIIKELKEISHRLECCVDNGIQCIHRQGGLSEELAECIRPIESIFAQLKNYVGMLFLDPILRDRPHVKDSHGVIRIYCGASSEGLRFSNISGEFQQSIQVIKFSEEGFTGTIDYSEVEEFTFTHKDAT